MDMLFKYELQLDRLNIKVKALLELIQQLEVKKDILDDQEIDYKYQEMKSGTSIEEH